ncbi:hypothetical protein M011DRAFT_483766 [Sporormia fimetaria CBS 119925]|uniref:Uncharacterized protein n=1 Tax=Sporormia fimetaria CBS 119925 TaxID=1340428 RepID=A0A6A6VM16_9PLEO|nr:hypothetical protein M011DRAFT_483766 [Sporormia fimetaria CBS 119925]
MAEVEVAFIKRGLWTHHEQGHVLGRTITNDVKTGNILVALLAVVSTIGTAHLWHLVTFCIHQLRADGRATDALFRQQQALLRTAPPPSSVVPDTIKLWRSWRGKAKRPFLRSLVIMVIAVLFSIGTIAESIFSSLAITHEDLVVLVNSPFCGWLNLGEGRARSALLWRFPSGTDIGQLHRGVVASLPSVSPAERAAYSSTARLSFPDICGYKDAVSIDSDLVDVNAALGLNLPTNEGVRYRKKTTCQILPVEGYSELINASEWAAITQTPNFRESENNRGNFLLLDYGPSSTAWPNGTARRDTTAALDYRERMIKNGGFKSGLYVHHASSQLPATLHSQFQPIPELRRDDGDTSLELVSFTNVMYTSPIDDPFFTAHTKRWKLVSQQGISATNQTIYLPDWPARGTGCLHQYQFCHKRGSTEFCSPLAGIPGTVTQDEFPGATELQLAVIQLLARSGHLFLGNVGSRVAHVADRMYEIQGPYLFGIPDDEWLRSLLKLNESSEDLGEQYVAPATDGERQLCGMQRMRKDGSVANISYFALVFVLTFSLFIACLDIFLLKFLVYVSSFRSALAPRIDRWIQDGVWQLQRRAYEAQGHTEWEAVDMEIPLTKEKRARTFKDLPSPAVTWRVVKEHADE